MPSEKWQPVCAGWLEKPLSKPGARRRGSQLLISGAHTARLSCWARPPSGMLMDIEDIFVFPPILLIYSLTCYVRTNLITARSPPTTYVKSSVDFLQEVWFYLLVSPAFSLIVGVVKLHFPSFLLNGKDYCREVQVSYFPATYRWHQSLLCSYPLKQCCLLARRLWKVNAIQFFTMQLTKKDICTL